MKIEQKDYTLELLDDHSGASLSGVLRLASPAAYEQAFEPLRKALPLGPAEGYTLDIAKLTFMNSSGITGISRLVLLARQLNKPFVFVVNDAIPWQRKTLASLQKLYPKLSIRAGV